MDDPENDRQFANFFLDNYRVPLVLRYYGELSYDEIAQQLGLKSYLAALKFRAEQELRRKL